MKRYFHSLFAVAMIFAAELANAQNLTVNNTKLKDLNGEHIFVITYQVGFEQKLDAVIDYGQPEKYRSPVKEGDKDFVFNSPAHILNVLRENGWEFVSIEMSFINAGGGVTMTYYLFKKKSP